LCGAHRKGQVVKGNGTLHDKGGGGLGMGGCLGVGGGVGWGGLVGGGKCVQGWGGAFAEGLISRLTGSKVYDRSRTLGYIPTKYESKTAEMTLSRSVGGIGAWVHREGWRNDPPLSGRRSKEELSGKVMGPHRLCALGPNAGSEPPGARKDSSQTRCGTEKRDQIGVKKRLQFRRKNRE